MRFYPLWLSGNIHHQWVTGSKDSVRNEIIARPTEWWEWCCWLVCNSAQCWLLPLSRCNDNYCLCWCWSMAADGNVPSISRPTTGAPSLTATGAEKYYAKHGTGQGFLSGRSSQQSVEETPIFWLLSSPDISSTIESLGLSKFSGQKINVFPITPGPDRPKLSCLLS